ncbi:MAG TPA: hypothetical protein VE975_03305, partial [Actinomycetota bacterium]|nr:hypothetical protein [Actinomycetota bacterium]
ANHGEKAIERGRTTPAPRPTATPPAIRQAKWRVRVYPAGAPGKLHSDAANRARAQGHHAARQLRLLFDDLFLHDARREEAVRRMFIPPAARRFLQARPWPSPGTEKIHLVKRSLRIGVAPNTARRAAAAVSLSVKAQTSGKTVRFRQQTVLWLARSRKAWHVIGFELSQKPVAGPVQDHAGRRSPGGGSKKHETGGNG